MSPQNKFLFACRGIANVCPTQAYNLIKHIEFKRAEIII
ncbi:hypothetical protein APHCR_0426 [Anaplasma phagocytophilum str. CR1007]|nr:hypothetical protein APHCR_0426 [Anaplasma phagocytophilum str. CR1007]